MAWLWAALWRLAASEALLELPNRGRLEVESPTGYCMRQNGPFSDPELSAAAKSLSLWKGEHLLCFQDEDLSEASFVVSPVPKLPEGQEGDFGFGREVSVDLRPRITTSALWPLQARTPSLGVAFRGRAATAVALRTTVGKATKELPLVSVRFRQQWAIDVQPVDESADCRLEGIVGASRIACRFTGDAPMQLVIFCGPCATRDAHLEVSAGREQQETSGPWLGVSSQNDSQWTVTVRDKLDDKEVFKEYTVAAVRGGQAVQWRESRAQRHVRILGLILQATLLTSAVLCLVSPSAPLRGGLSVAALSLPYMATLASRQDAPLLMQSAFESWPQPFREPFSLFLEACLALVLVVLFHGYDALQFLQANGPGSAEEMPHGLCFGAWELKALSYLASTLGCAGLGMARDGFTGSRWFHTIYGLFGTAVLLALLVLPWKVLQRLRELFQEGRIICLQHPEGLQYVDRVCDQILAIPSTRSSRILGSWTESRSWQTSPPVAMIQEVEHHGGCKDRTGEHWDRNWSSGPWLPRDMVQPPSISELPTPSNGLRHRPVSVDSGSAEPLIRGGWKSPKAGNASPLMAAHPVSVTTRFCFAQGQGYAGVCGLPWLDAVVPADELGPLELSLSQLRLRVQARQLTGPLTSGRLSACFALTHRKPWWWSYDFTLKVLVGCAVCVSPGTTDARPLQLLWLMLMAFIALWVIYCQPFGHWVENAAAALGALALPASTAFYIFADQVVQTPQLAINMVLLLGYIPVLVALVAGLYSIRVSAKDLPMSVTGWGELSGNRLGYQRLGLDEDDSPVNVKPQVMDIHLADAVLLPPLNSEAPQIRLPCEVKIPLWPMHLWMKGAVAVSSCLDRPPSVAVPTQLLLGPRSEVETPWATLITPSKGLLLYQDQERNGGMSWQEGLRKFFEGEPALGREAERLLSEERESLAALEVLD